jgi:hypothetical protein
VVDIELLTITAIWHQFDIEWVSAARYIVDMPAQLSTVDAQLTSAIVKGHRRRNAGE